MTAPYFAQSRLILFSNTRKLTFFPQDINDQGLTPLIAPFCQFIIRDLHHRYPSLLPLSVPDFICWVLILKILRKITLIPVLHIYLANPGQTWACHQSFSIVCLTTGFTLPTYRVPRWITLILMCFDFFVALVLRSSSAGEETLTEVVATIVKNPL